MSKTFVAGKKRPDKIVPFKLPMMADEDTSQFYYILGLSLGVFGLLMKNKYFSWVGLLCNVISVLNRRASDSDSSRGSISSIAFSIMGLVMLYAQMFTAPANSSIFDSTRK